MKKEKYKMPEHPNSQCHMEEDAATIDLVSYETKVAYYDKKADCLHILGRYTNTTDRHCLWFSQYLYRRYRKETMTVQFHLRMYTPVFFYPVLRRK